MSDKTIEEIRQWIGTGDGVDHPLLDWMGRESEHHMPEGTWLCQNTVLPDPVAGDEDPNMSFTLAFHRTTRGDWAEPGDYVCKMPDGTFEARKKELIDLLKQDGEPCFYSRDYRDVLTARRNANPELEFAFKDRHLDEKRWR